MIANTNECYRIKSLLARMIVYTTNYIRVKPIFWVPVPILPVLGLPRRSSQHGAENVGSALIQFGTVKLFTLSNLSEPNLFFWYPCQFHPSQTKSAA